MLGLAALSGLPKAGALIGVVLAEAMVLYVGYGALVSQVGGAVTAAIRGD